MKLTFIGADHEVTGSCHLLTAAGRSILIDYGMEQGRNIFENAPLPIPASEIDAVFVTHAHIDHTGLLPLLGARGFRGRVYATAATCDLCDIMLLDSAGIQQFEAEWRNRKGRRKGLPPFVPLYTAEDVDRIMRCFVPCPYDKVIDVFDGIRIRFNDAGHLLGSAAIEVWAKEQGKETKIVFSGDVGNHDQPILKEPKKIDSADYLLIESTYGDRSHGERPDYRTALAEVIQRTLDRGGNVVIPSFAVGRTQEMLYIIREIKAEKLVHGHDGFPVYVDSPLATRATGIFNGHYTDCFDGEAQALIAEGINPITFPGLKLALTTDESRAINEDGTPKVILSASGMCEAGRIKHHLKQAKEVTLFGETIRVQAEIVSLKGISGHADREGLLDWASGFRKKPKRVFVVHGEDGVEQSFCALLHEKLGLQAEAPYSGTVWNLADNVCEKKTEGVPFVRLDAEGHPLPAAASTKTTPYLRLEHTADRLQSLVRALKGRPNKELAQMADQLAALCSATSGRSETGLRKGNGRAAFRCRPAVSREPVPEGRPTGRSLVQSGPERFGELIRTAGVLEAAGRALQLADHLVGVHPFHKL